MFTVIKHKALLYNGSKITLPVLWYEWHPGFGMRLHEVKRITSHFVTRFPRRIEC